VVVKSTATFFDSFVYGQGYGYTVELANVQGGSEVTDQTFALQSGLSFLTNFTRVNASYNIQQTSLATGFQQAASVSGALSGVAGLYATLMGIVEGMLLTTNPAQADQDDTPTPSSGSQEGEIGSHGSMLRELSSRQLKPFDTQVQTTGKIKKSISVMNRSSSVENLTPFYSAVPPFQ